MPTESPIEQAMRLAASRLAVHAYRTRQQALALEQPQGFGETHDGTCHRAARELWRSAAEDQCRIDELRELSRTVKV